MRVVILNNTRSDFNVTLLSSVYTLDWKTFNRYMFDDGCPKRVLCSIVRMFDIETLLQLLTKEDMTQ